MMIAAAFLTLALAAPALAHSGAGGGFTGDRLEAEDYSTPDASCDPDFDSEHTQTASDAGASGGEYVFLPHSGCGIDYGTTSFDDWREFTEARIRVGGTSSTMTYEVRVVVDGSTAAKGSVTTSHSAGFVTVALTSTATTSPGNHDLRVEYSVTSGPSYANLDIDYVDSEVVTNDLNAVTITSAPSTVASGATFQVCWRVQGSGAITHTDLHYTNDEILSTTSGTTADRSGSATQDFCDNLTAPVIGEVRVQAHAVGPNDDLFSATTTVAVV